MHIHIFENLTTEDYQKVFFDIVQYGNKLSLEALLRNLHVFEKNGFVHLVELAKDLIGRGYADMVKRYQKKFKGSWSKIEEFLP